MYDFRVLYFNASVRMKHGVSNSHVFPPGRILRRNFQRTNLMNPSRAGHTLALSKWSPSFHKLARATARTRVKEEAAGKFFAAPAWLLFGNARGNLIALIIAPGAYLRRCLVTRTSSAPCPLVCAPGDLLYGPLNLKSTTLFSRQPR